jgi:hypothetical protein
VHAEGKIHFYMNLSREPSKGVREMMSRRDVLATTAVAGVVTAATMTVATAAPQKSPISYGNPDDPPQGAVNATNPRSITDPGPQNPAIRSQFPSAFSPPPTDVGSMPLSWATFNNAPRRIQNGGWPGYIELVQANRTAGAGPCFDHG